MLASALDSRLSELRSNPDQPLGKLTGCEDNIDVLSILLKLLIQWNIFLTKKFSSKLFVKPVALSLKI